MKILYTNPFGALTDWNARMRRMVELLREEGHEVRLLLVRDVQYTGKTGWYRTLFQKTYDEFQPDVILSHGAGLASNFVSKYGYKTVVDLGSFDSSEYMIQKSGYVDNYKQLMEMDNRHLISRLNSGGIYLREKYTLENAKATLTFDGWENDLAKKIFKKANIIAHSPLYIKDIDHKLPWDQRENKAIAVAAKWGRKSKNGKFVHHFNKHPWQNQAEGTFKIWRVGHSGGWIDFLPNEDIKKLMGQVKVVVCPMLTGANMVIAEGLKMGANVVVQDAHPFHTYYNKEISFSLGDHQYQKCLSAIQKAFKRHYPSKKGLPDERTQIRKLIKILKSNL